MGSGLGKEAAERFTDPFSQREVEDEGSVKIQNHLQAL